MLELSPFRRPFLQKAKVFWPWQRSCRGVKSDSRPLVPDPIEPEAASGDFGWFQRAPWAGQR